MKVLYKAVVVGEGTSFFVCSKCHEAKAKVSCFLMFGAISPKSKDNNAFPIFYKQTGPEQTNSKSGKNKITHSRDLRAFVHCSIFLSVGSAKLLKSSDNIVPACRGSYA